MVSIRRHARCWLTYLAVGGLVLGCGSNLASGQESQQAGTASHETAAKPPAPPISPASTRTPSTYVYPYPCERPENAEQDNLCIERRAARAAEKQIVWAERTFWLGVFGTVFIILALGASGWAAYAATRSAKVAEKALIDLERPHVFATISPHLGVDIKVFEYPYVEFAIVNYGRFPAEILECTIAFAQQVDVPKTGTLRDDLHRVVGNGDPILGIRHQINDESKTIWQTEPFTGEAVAATPKESGNYETFFFVSIRYRGLKPTDYTSVSYWKWDHSAERWAHGYTNRT